MSRTFRVVILLAFAALAWMITPAYSTSLTTYTNLAAWQAATSGVQTADFEGLTPPGTATTYNSSTGVSNYSGVEFIGYTSSGSSYIQIIDTSAVSWYNYGTGDALILSMDRPNSSSPLPYIHVVFTTPVTAFGGDLFTASPHALSFTITVLGSTFTAATNDQPNTAFFGITSDTPITSVDFTLAGTIWNGGSQALMDNFRWGTASAQTDTPEAATFLMIGSGLIGLVYLKKRIRRVQMA